MELKAGYKQSAIGLIPDDWEVNLLGELFDFCNGFNAGHESYGKGIPFISTLDVLRFSHIQYEDILGKVLVEKGVESYLVKKGDILFTRTSETQEEVGMTSVYMGEEPVTFGGFIIRGRQKQPHFDEKYLGYAFKDPLVRRQIISLGQGGIHVNIGQAELKKVYISIPLIIEQKAISSALSDVDALLSSLDALIAKKRDMKTAAMQGLLTGKARLPGFSGKWVEKTLSTVAMIVGGGTPSTAESSYWNGSIPWFTPAEISTAGKYISHSERNISEEGLKKSSARLLPVGTILLTTRASIGLRAILTVPATTNQGFQSLIVNSDTDSEFIYYLLENIQPELVKQASGSTFLEISPRKLGEISLRLPSSSTEQAAIAAVLSDIDAEITALEARRAKVQALKQGMMQELLTGKTRLVPTGDQHG